MNKNAIQKYAIWARTELIEQVKQRAFQYDITEEGYGDQNATVIAGRVLEPEEKRQRQSFIEIIKTNGFKQTVEEVAYTWFNRFVALRYMEVNDFLPTHVRVFSDSSGAFNPEILKNVLHLDLEGLNKTKVSELLNDNKTDELYRYLLLTQCNALNSLLPEMFERLGAYTEMLLPNNILKPEGVIGRLVKDIPEEDFRDAVQIIGWLYQYYNTEPKQTVFNGLKKNIKITKENISAATQLFTPDWIVRYMVENSLGRLWLESHPGSLLRANWKYYLDEEEQTPEVAERLRVFRNENTVKSPEDIKVIDPCMGSGHILVYAFDVLMQIYTSEGYSERDAAKLILEKNLYGLEIDRRAYQLAYFALMMKARQYNRRILTQEVRPQVYEPTGYADGMEYGSLIRVDKLEPMPEQPEGQLELFEDNYFEKLNVWNFRRLLAQKYDVVITNPPYMGDTNMGTKLGQFVKDKYPDSKNDLFATFIEQCICLASDSGAISLVTMHSWMFLSSFEKIRKKMLHSLLFETINHLGMEAFEGIIGKVVSTVAFTARKCEPIKDYIGEAIRLTDYYDALRWTKEQEFFNAKNHYRYSQADFEKIPGNPFSYWVGHRIYKVFEEEKTISSYGLALQGTITGDNERFLRFWFEVGANNSDLSATTRDSFNSKWLPHNKGGAGRRWYGNREYVINWERDGFEIRNFYDAKGKLRSRPQNIGKFFTEGITWSDLTTLKFTARVQPEGSSFDATGPTLFLNSNEHKQFIIGYLNTKVFQSLLNITCAGLHYNNGTIAKLPIKIHFEQEDVINNIVNSCVVISKTDWDSFEISWEFKIHPLICQEPTVAAAFGKWECDAEERFNTLKKNEEELNRIFIEIYGLQEELTPEVEDKDVTVRRTDLGREIRSLISYAVGCMLGRYSTDCEGLVYAGGDWDAGKYKTFSADADNILPICDDEYFDDDIVGRFVEFVKAVYGVDTLEENLRFIADALGGKGTPRGVIRKYFLNEFYKDHLKIYQKRPIYWMFDSGKKNGFKALIYMHRYSSDLLATLRTDYVHEQQERYRTQLTHIVDTLTTATGAERAQLLKRQIKLTEQLQEITVFEEKVHHLADQKITIDLDDGVKKNYALFTDVLAKI